MRRSPEELDQLEQLFNLHDGELREHIAAGGAAAASNRSFRNRSSQLRDQQHPLPRVIAMVPVAALPDTCSV